MLHICGEMHSNFRKLQCERRWVTEIRSWGTAFSAGVAAVLRRAPGTIFCSVFSLCTVVHLSLCRELTASHYICCVVGKWGSLAGSMLQSAMQSSQGKLCSQWPSVTFSSHSSWRNWPSVKMIFFFLPHLIQRKYAHRTPLDIQGDLPTPATSQAPWGGKHRQFMFFTFFLSLFTVPEQPPQQPHSSQWGEGEGRKNLKRCRQCGRIFHS